MSAGTYTAISLATATAQLATKFGDPTQTHWTPAELQALVITALRTWSAWTQSFRARAVLASIVNEAFYDLPTAIPTLRRYTVTDADLLTQLAYTLMEPPPSGAAWPGASGQYQLSDLVTALTRRRDRFLLETGAVLARRDVMVAPLGAGRVALPETLITLRRAAWLAVDGVRRPLRRDDEWSLTSFRTQWVQHPTRPPSVYSVSTTPPLVVQLAAAPLDTGTLELVSVERGAAIDLTTPAVLGIPDDWSWVVYFGALAELFSQDGLALDVGRAQLCEARWAHGITLAKAASVVLSARINNVTCMIGSLSEADAYAPSWQAVPGSPAKILTAGQNLVALWPPPGVLLGGGTVSVTLDVVRNVPVPILPTDDLQVGLEIVEPILDYAQSLALIKEGTVVMAQSQPLVQRMLDVAGVTLRIQQSSQPNRRAAFDQQTNDTRALSREQPTPVEAGVA